MHLKAIPPVKKHLIHVIIETPKGSQNKYAYDPEWDLFRIKKTLPMGMTFPFDFGFIPNTLAGDGDPLDVLVIMDQHAYPGCLITCRGIGILKARQTEEDKNERNDRIIAIASTSKMFGNVKDIDKLDTNMISEIEQFFADYNRQEGKAFAPIAWEGKKAVYETIKKLSVK